MIVSPDSVPVRSPNHRWGKIGAFFQILFPSKGINKTITRGCERYTSPDSRNNIASFTKENHISPSSVERCRGSPSAEECWSRFDSLNDFFIRRRTGLPLPDPECRDIVSPADAFVVYLNTPMIQQRLWIKGKSFHVQELFPSSNVPKHFHLFVCRLAPHHYHRFHSPANGVVTDIYFTGTEYYSVHPWVVQSSVDVLTENVRCVVEISLDHSQEKVWVACIGATCVGSIQLHPRVGEKVSAMEEIGYFQFGGSCIVLLCPTTYTPEIGTQWMAVHTFSHVETELRVGHPLLSLKN